MTDANFKHHVAFELFKFLIEHHGKHARNNRFVFSPLECLMLRDLKKAALVAIIDEEKSADLFAGGLFNKILDRAVQARLTMLSTLLVELKAAGAHMRIERA